MQLMRSGSDGFHGGDILRRVVRLTIETNSMTGATRFIMSSYVYLAQNLNHTSCCSYHWFCDICGLPCKSTTLS